MSETSYAHVLSFSHHSAELAQLALSCQVVTIPGAGFGPGGEGFLRLSAFASRENCEEASERLKKMFA